MNEDFLSGRCGCFGDCTRLTWKWYWSKNYTCYWGKNTCYWGKNYICIKNVHAIYFIKYINYFPQNAPGLLINYGSKYVWVLNISGPWICLWFWICQSFEQTRVLIKPGFWIYQVSEYASGYARVLNRRLVLNLPGFWICQGYTGFWIYLIMSRWICLGMCEYAGICVNMPKSAWMAFVLYFPIVMPCLLEGVVTYFNVFTKLEILVWMKMRLFSWRHAIWFSSCKYFSWFLF